jgi:dihydrofolate reductase
MEYRFVSDSSGIIGDNGQPYTNTQTIPWKLPSDLRRFKMLTVGKFCIMGRKTWDSLPKKPLPNRKNIILTTNKNLQTINWYETYKNNLPIYCNSIDEIYKLANSINQEIMVIGGSEIYKIFLEKKYVDRIYLTELKKSYLSELYSPVYFPNYLLKEIKWFESYSEQFNLSSDNNLEYTFKILDRDM